MSDSNRHIGRRALIGVLAVLGSGATAAAETRALSLFNTHTQERATIVFKRNGQYDQAGIQELQRMLRDWRRNEVTRMDPQLFDLVWDVYRESGSSEPIHIVSGYRSPATNSMLRSRSRGVAKLSQHMLGKAMDFYLPDVPLDRLRAIGMRKQFGGVGFYPTSGSPFVHMDTGSVRAWPRMSREQLARLFPDGKTAHLPADGPPLARYEEALAEVQARKGRGEVAVASSGGSGRGLLATIFGRSNAASDDDEDEGAPLKQQVLRQGPPPPGSKAVAAADDGESYSPPKAAAAAPAAAPAPGSLVALPMPTPAPRAPGSLVTASSGVTPAGWVQGPQPAATASAATPGPALQPIDVPIPSAKPGTTVVASATPLPSDFVQQRPKPGSGLPSAAPATAAIAAVTGSTTPSAVAATLLGYAPQPPAPKPTVDHALAEARSAPEPRTTTAQRPASGGVLLAALPAGNALATASSTTDALRSAAPIAAPARAAAKGDRTDPLARFVARIGERPEGRLLDTGATTRTAAFGELHHPDQEHLPQLLTKPGQLVLSGFGPATGGDLRSDRFAGPAVIALAVIRTE